MSSGQPPILAYYIRTDIDHKKRNQPIHHFQVAHPGERAGWRFIEFFTANIRNRNTRAAYAHAVTEFFRWCESRNIRDLEQIRAVVIAAYIEQHKAATPTVKQHLAAIRMLFDWLVIGQVVPMNPAASVRGPKYVIKRGKTPVLSADEARRLLDAIETNDIVGLRDRALIGLMSYTFARVSAVVGMHLEDYYQNGKRAWIRLHEKGGKLHEVPAHHNAEAYVDAYIAAAGIADQKKGPLFRSVDRHRHLTLSGMNRTDVLRMVKRRAAAAGLPYSTTPLAAIPSGPPASPPIWKTAARLRTPRPSLPTSRRARPSYMTVPQTRSRLMRSRRL